MSLTTEEVSAKFLKLSEYEKQQVSNFIEALQSKVIEPSAQPRNSLSIYQVVEQAGLIGCIETNEQLSVNYKEKLDFSSKYGITK
jgi:hypothetical protein